MYVSGVSSVPTSPRSQSRSTSLRSAYIAVMTSLPDAATTPRWNVASAATNASGSPDRHASSRRTSSVSSCFRSRSVRRSAASRAAADSSAERSSAM